MNMYNTRGGGGRSIEFIVQLVVVVLLQFNWKWIPVTSKNDKFALNANQAALSVRPITRVHYSIVSSTHFFCIEISEEVY